MATRLLVRALHLGLLLVAAGAAQSLPGHRGAAGLVFALLAVYAHAVARILGAQGLQKGVVFLEVLPFFAFGTAYFGRLVPAQAGLVVAAGTAAGAAILVGEAWIVKGVPTFSSSLGFIGACALAGLGLATLTPWLVLGPALLLGLAAGYGLARRHP